MHFGGFCILCSDVQLGLCVYPAQRFSKWPWCSNRSEYNFYSSMVCQYWIPLSSPTCSSPLFNLIWKGKLVFMTWQNFSRLLSISGAVAHQRPKQTDSCFPNFEASGELIIQHQRSMGWLVCFHRPSVELSKAKKKSHCRRKLLDWTCPMDLCTFLTVATLHTPAPSWKNPIDLIPKGFPWFSTGEFTKCSFVLFAPRTTTCLNDSIQGHRNLICRHQRLHLFNHGRRDPEDDASMSWGKRRTPSMVWSKYQITGMVSVVLRTHTTILRVNTQLFPRAKQVLKLEPRKRPICRRRRRMIYHLRCLQKLLVELKVRIEQQLKYWQTDPDLMCGEAQCSNEVPVATEIYCSATVNFDTSLECGATDSCRFSWILQCFLVNQRQRFTNSINL